MTVLRRIYISPGRRMPYPATDAFFLKTKKVINRVVAAADRLTGELAS